MTDWEKPQPVEQKQITDAIGELQDAESLMKVTPIECSPVAHAALARVSQANTTGQILSLRMTEHIMWRLEEINGHNNQESFFGSLSYKGLKSSGLAAAIIAIVVAIVMVYGIVEYLKLQTREAVATALVHTEGKE